jgi:type I restriction enzyme S subunit
MNENVQPDVFSKFNHHPEHIPDLWDMLPIKRISKIRYGLSQPPAESPTGLPLIRATNIKSGKVLIEDMMYVDPTDIPLNKDVILSKGDIIVVRSGAYTGDSAIIPNEYDGAIAGYDIIVTLLKDFSPFVAWQLLSPHVREFQFELNSLRAAQPHLNAEQLGETLIFVPTIPEQHAIAAFLDRETAKIDALIEKKRRLIGLLEEKRAAIISHVVTKGLDPNAPMKDSGVEWLGEIPAGWEVKRLKRVSSRIGSGKTPRGGGEVYCDNGIIFLRSQNIHFDGLHLDDVVYIDETVDSEMASTRVIPKDILLNITGASIGRCSIAPKDFHPANVNQHVCIIRPVEELVDPDFLHKIICSKIIQSYIFSVENGTSREGLTFSQIANFIITLPNDLDEQRDIAIFLDQETAKIDTLISKIHEAINKLQEYRTALISAAVTGKIDVREASL